jgi:uncharacterized membrane protein
MMLSLMPTFLAAIDISNPATPWIVLAVVIAGWLAAYLYVSAEPRP